MNKKSILKRSDYEDYLVHIYFGSKSDHLHNCMNRAYLDFNRTIHGLGRLAAKDMLRDHASRILRAALSALKRDGKVSGQKEYDDWHRSTCQELSLIFDRYGYPRFYVGQAQKWINMTLKYIYVLGEDRIPGFGAVYHFCHVPLDNILVERLIKYGFPRLPCVWSRLDDYDEYLSRQEWIREYFPYVPLDVEFMLWLGRDIVGIKQISRCPTRRGGDLSPQLWVGYKISTVFRNTTWSWFS